MFALSGPSRGDDAAESAYFAFINHFQGLARGHFIARRFEAQYGQEAVRAGYLQL